LDTVLFRNEVVAQQEGFEDCGLFALAFATAICYKKDVSMMNFDQGSMREHYKTCINNQLATLFPVKDESLPRRSRRVESLLVPFTANILNL
jgi:hypothetical protein